MRLIIRYFFRGLRLVLAPIMLISEKLSTPKALYRSPEEQKAVNEACENLALYQFKSCPFCIKVRKEIARLGLKIELRDALNNPDHRQDLESLGGSTKVPCLRIRTDEGDDQWLYESDAIKAWLQEQFEPQQAHT